MLDQANTSATQEQDNIQQWQRLFRYHSPISSQTDPPANTQAYPNNNFSWGDTIYDKSEDTTRFYFQNIHGLQYHKRGGKISDTFKLMKSAQIDCAGLTEINTDLLQYSIRQNIKQSIQLEFHPLHYCYIMLTSQIPSSSSYKPGGTATILQGPMVGQHLKSESDEQGRWTIITLMAKGNRKLSHITC